MPGGHHRTEHNSTQALWADVAGGLPSVAKEMMQSWSWSWPWRIPRHFQAVPLLSREGGAPELGRSSMPRLQYTWQQTESALSYRCWAGWASGACLADTLDISLLNTHPPQRRLQNGARDELLRRMEWKAERRKRRNQSQRLHRVAGNSRRDRTRHGQLLASGASDQLSLHVLAVLSFGMISIRPSVRLLYRTKSWINGAHIHS